MNEKPTARPYEEALNNVLVIHDNVRTTGVPGFDSKVLTGIAFAYGLTIQRITSDLEEVWAAKQTKTLIFATPDELIRETFDAAVARNLTVKSHTCARGAGWALWRGGTLVEAYVMPCMPDFYYGDDFLGSASRPYGRRGTFKMDPGVESGLWREENIARLLEAARDRRDRAHEKKLERLQAERAKKARSVFGLKRYTRPKTSRW